MATIHINLPDDLEEDNNVNISNLHRTLTNLINKVNYGFKNIDEDNMTEDVAEKILSMAQGDSDE